MKVSLWTDIEVRNLFETIERVKNDNKPLKVGFCEHAKKYNRKENSVRNYYYHEIDNLSLDKERCARLGIDLAKHSKMKLVPFSKEQEQKFLQDIKKLTDGGMSVRLACFNLSGGDMKIMTRLQNKYQNMKEKKPNNLVVFKPKENVLTDSEINSLFMGLVRLIKKNTALEFSERFKEEKQKADNELKDAYAQIIEKEKEILLLKDDIRKMRLENEIKGKISKKQQKLKEKLEKTQKFVKLTN